MTDRKRLLRLRRLEAVRAIALQTAMAEAARAESTLAQLEALARRTQRLAADYADPAGAGDGQALRQTGLFAHSLRGLAADAGADADRARRHADDRMAELGLAERRRAAVAERAESQARALARAARSPVLGGRRPAGSRQSGTDLE